MEKNMKILLSGIVLSLASMTAFANSEIAGDWIKSNAHIHLNPNNTGDWSVVYNGEKCQYTGLNYKLIDKNTLHILLHYGSDVKAVGTYEPDRNIISISDSNNLVKEMFKGKKCESFSSGNGDYTKSGASSKSKSSLAGVKKR